FMTLPEFLSQDSDGYIHVAGHRIGLQDLVYYYNEGHSAEALLDMFPTLTLALIHKLIAFYLEHRVDVDAHVARGEAEMAQQRALVTFDKTTLPQHLATHLQAGNHCPGVFMLRRGSRLSQVVNHLALVAYAREACEWQDRIEFIPY